MLPHLAAHLRRQRPPTLRRVLLRRALCAAVAALAWAGCLSPTLPLPPPEAPHTIQQVSGEPGVWLVAGESTPGATVLIRHPASGKIVGTEDQGATGHYAIELRAQECDQASVLEVQGERVSPETPFTVEKTQNGVPVSDTCSSPQDGG
ncbi:MAG: hypothetical protein HY744_01105 [Deltaproteobacteria bacterium]|nr:hypothetical protein [Deltaproteobacteria bacterium]